MLYSSPSQRAEHQDYMQKVMSPPKQMSGSGSTIASIAFTHQNSYEKRFSDSAVSQDFANLTMEEEYPDE